MSDEQNDNQSDGGALRKQLEEALKRNQEAEAEISQLRGYRTQRELGDVLTAKGVSPKLARFITADGVDPSADGAVDKWLADNADVIGGVPATVTSPQPNASSEDQSAFSAMQQPMASSPADQDKVAALMASIPDDATPNQVMAAYRASGL